MNGTLILTWGNPGRQDDGLGPALAAALGAKQLPRVTVETDYQLQVECAADVAQHDRVLFVDADRTCDGPFRMHRLTPGNARPAFSTHSVAPETVLALSRELFGAEPEAWLMGIRGYEFDDFGQGLSEGALANLQAAVEYVSAACTSQSFLAPEALEAATPDSKGEPCKTAST
jgi:hydrogenase maturation protease